jgi:hypothetical protein
MGKKATISLSEPKNSRVEYQMIINPSAFFSADK